jgi:hypothetical protein
MSPNPNPFATTQGAATPQPQSSQSHVNGAPAQLDETQLNGAGQTVPAAPEPLLSLDDPLLTSETLTAKEGDAFADPPPPPDRIYRVKLSLRGVSAKDAGQDISQFSAGQDVAPWIPGTAKDKQSGLVTGGFAKTIINVQIFDPKFPEYDGLYLQIPYKWTDTRENRQGLSKVMTILTLLKQPSGKPWLVPGQKYGHKLMMETFVRALAGEPELNCRSEWSWNCEGCAQAGKISGQYARSIDGMQKFPQLKPGVYSPEMLCQVNRAHGYSKARAMAAQFFPLAG